MNDSVLEQGQRILVVDDNPHNVDMLCRRLQRRGYQSTPADGGQLALDRLAQQDFDLVVLDIMMPEVDGFQVLETIRRNHCVSDLPVIMATAKDQSEDIVEAMSRGANDYVTKPVDFPVLVARIQTQLALKQANDENKRLLQQLADRTEFIKSLFGRFISDEVVQQLLEAPSGPQLGGELRPVSIVFADIRGFTSLSEKLTPGQVVTLLNNYLGTMTEVIDAYNGTVNEFYGDGLLAFFGAPVTQPDHAATSIRCALAMEAAMEEVNRKNRESGLPEIHMGVAVNTGDVIVGNVGSEKRFKYGVIGSAVNVASRVQGLAKDGEVLVTEACSRAAGEGFRFGEPQTVELRGLSQSLTVCPVQNE